MKKGFIIVFVFINFLSYSQNWKTNFEDAKKEAMEQNKNILLVFSGS